jgi:plasmid stability protein
MTLTLDLPEDEIKLLAAKAQARGISAEDYARQALKRSLHEEDATEPFWKAFTRRVHAVPADVFERMPADGASEHGHYLYGRDR